MLARLQGVAAFDKRGISITTVGRLIPMLHCANVFASELAAVIPRSEEYLLPIYSYMRSPEYEKEVRKIDQKLGVTNATFLKVPFDKDRWNEVAQSDFPNGIPLLATNDPTQWIFHGHPCASVYWNESAKRLAIAKARMDATVMHVAVARLMGYRWPSELDKEMKIADEMREVMKRNAELDNLVDGDGIVCIPPLNRELPAAERVLAVLERAYGDDWTGDTLGRLM